MKFLVNDKEYAEILAVLLVRESLRKDKTRKVLPPGWKKTHKLKAELKQMLTPNMIPGLRLAPRDADQVLKVKEYIMSVVADDLAKWKNSYSGSEKIIKDLRTYINKHFNRFTRRDREIIHALFLKSNRETLTKTLSQAWKDNRTFQPRAELDIGTSNPLFIRNIVHNEDVIKTRIANQLPFWFMDTGYTNFLESGKKWHRICKDSIHCETYQRFDTKDRLNMFPVMPAPWRMDGNDIIVIEPSATVCYLFNIDIEQWKASVLRDLAQHLVTPKNIIFREKAGKKVRGNFYQELLEQDAYCVIHYNSNAAVEAIWAGVPVVTLGEHITRPVSTHDIEHINNLRCPDLKKWIRWLSYNQFTIEEISNGTARDILENVIYA